MGSSVKSEDPKRYFIGCEEQVICLSPVDEIKTIKVNDAIAWDGSIDGSITNNRTITIDKKDLFGGDNSEGGIAGKIEVRFGNDTQNKSVFCLDKIKDAILSATRGVLSIVMSDFYIGNNPYDKAWHFRIKSTLKDKDYNNNWYQEKASIVHGEVIDDFEITEHGRKLNRYYHLTNSARKPNNLVGFYLNQPNASYDLEFNQTLDIKYFNENLDDIGSFSKLKNYPLMARYIGTQHFGDASYYYQTCDNFVAHVCKCISYNKYIDKNTSIFQGERKIYNIDEQGSEYINKEAEFYFDVGNSSYDDNTGSFIINNKGRLTINLNYTSRDPHTNDAQQTKIYNLSTTVNTTDDVVFVFGDNAYSLSDNFILTRYYPYQERINTEPIIVTETIDLSGYNSSSNRKPLSLYANHDKNVIVLLEESLTDGAYFVKQGNFNGSNVEINLQELEPTIQSNDFTTSNSYFVATKERIYLIAKDYYFVFFAEQVNFGDTTQVDYNPVHAIREAITNPIWGLGKNPNIIDDNNFMQVADKLYEEKFGISFVFEDGDKISEFIQKVLNIIGGVLRFNRNTGLLEIKLLRDDYDKNELPYFDENNIIEIDEITRTALSECINQVTLKYTDCESGEQASFVVQDLGLLQQTEEVNNSDIDYPYIHWKDTARQVALRELAGLSSQFLGCEITTNTDGRKVNIGDCILVNFPKLNINNIVFRVNKISYGSSSDNTVKITVVQDKFDYPTTFYKKEEQKKDVEPIDRKDSVIYSSVKEVPFYLLYKSKGFTDLMLELEENPLFAKGLPLISRIQAENVSRVTSFISYDNNEFNKNYDKVPFSVSCILDEDLDYLTTELKYSNSNGLTRISDTSYIGFIDDEIVWCKQNYNNGIIEISRGCLDTVPQKHQKGTIVFFVNIKDFPTFAEDFVNNYINVKYTSRSVYGETSVLNSPSNELMFNSRCSRPYPVANVKIDNEYYPSDLRGAKSIRISYNTRNRLTQLSDYIYSFVDENIEKEDGTKVFLRWYDNDVFIEETELATRDMVVPFPNNLGSGDITIRIVTILNDIECYQPYELTFKFDTDEYYFIVTYSNNLLKSSQKEELNIEMYIEDGVLKYDIEDTLDSVLSFELNNKKELVKVVNQ